LNEKNGAGKIVKRTAKTAVEKFGGEDKTRKREKTPGEIQAIKTSMRDL
jgi:hypothetical protein